MSEMEETLNRLEERANAASGVSWWKREPTIGEPAVEVRFADGKREHMMLRRDTVAASEADVDFVAHLRDDILRLIAGIRGNVKLSRADVMPIEQRLHRASPGPWRAFVETDGGVGGTNVIRITELDDEPDLYLWIGGKIAPAADFLFVADARNELPRLLAAFSDE